MKPLIITNHALEQYAARTGRNQYACAAELINSIRTGKEVTFNDAIKENEFNVTRRFKGDRYYVWYDPKIDENLLAIVASDGAIKTILRKQMFGYNNRGAKQRYERGMHTYGYESPKKSRCSRVR